MSIFSDEFEDDALPEVVEAFSRGVTLYQASNANPLAVTALIEWQHSAEDRTNGRASKQAGNVKLVQSTGLVFDAVSTADRLKIGDHYYAITAVSEPECGKLPMTVSRKKEDLRTGSRGVM